MGMGLSEAKIVIILNFGRTLDLFEFRGYFEDTQIKDEKNQQQ